MAKRSLLLVDGDSKSLRVLEVSLKKAGFNVVTASAGAEALEKAKDSLPDLVISDTDMEGMDGYDFCREFKKDADWGEIPFIFLTGQTEIENKIRGLELGVDDYLTKPIYIKEILTRVRILLQKRDRANFEQKKDTNTRFAGRLSDMGVIDLIQTIEVSRKTGLIHFGGDENRQATIFFKNGQVIDAEAGHLQGADAVYRLLTWSDGDFEALFRPVRRKPLIEMSSQALLMEGMRRLDEWGRMQEQLPPLTQQFEVVYDELWDRLSELPDEVNQILKLFDARRTLEEVIDGANIGDLEAVEIISKLYFEGIIVEAGTATGSGTFALEDLKIKREQLEIPPDLEDTIPEATAPTSEELGDTGASAAPSDSGDLAAAAEVAVHKSKSKVKSRDPYHPVSSGTTAELSGLLDKAIGDATPVASTSDSQKEELKKQTKRTTAKGIPVAQVPLMKRATTVEEQLAENLRKSKAQPEGTKKRGTTQQLPATPPPPADPVVADSANSSENIEASEDEEEVTTKLAPAMGTDANLSAESVDEEQETTDVETPEPEAPAESVHETPGEDEHEETPGADDDASDWSAVAPAEGEVSDAEEDVSESSEEDTALVADADSSGSGSIKFEADYADDDDVAPNKPYEEEPDTAGVISADRDNSGIISGSVASEAKLSRKSETDKAKKSEDEDEDDRRSVPPISQHDSDEEEEESGTSLWLPVGIIGAAAIAFLIFKSMSGGGSDKPSGTGAVVTGAPGDARPLVAAPEDAAPPPIAAIDAGTQPAIVAVPDAAVLVPIPDAAVLVPIPDAPPQPTIDPPASDQETQLRNLLSAARKARRQGDKLEALQLIDEALELRKSTTALLLKAETLLSLGDSRAALKVATQLTDVGPRRAPAWRIRGLAAYEHKNYAEARKSFTRYLELRPKAGDAADVRALLDSL